MLPFVLILLVASSALAAPYIQVDQVSINDVAPLQSDGSLINSALTDRAFEILDGSDAPINVITMENIINDVANQNNPESQALAVAQSLGLLAAMSTGIPGDACVSATVIDAYVRNPGSERNAAAQLLRNLASILDSIVQLADNPKAARFLRGPQGNCNGGGRVYSFEAAWDAILSNASPSSAGLVNEEYCTAKRLYNALSVRSNNVAAYVTALSLPPVNQALARELVPLARFVYALGTNNAASAVGAAKQSLQRAANSL